jgi:hypothetical protein
MPEAKMNALNARHLEFDDGLLTSGQFIEAEALEPGSATTCVRVRQGKSSVVDGPYAETKEQVAGFYLIEARDLNEAIQVAVQIPSAPLGTIEVRPCRDLIVDGVKHKASRKPR